eukprot:6496911-Alexandrium_andersonii.AAC.1
MSSTTCRTGRACPLALCTCASAYFCLKTVLYLGKTRVPKGCNTEVVKLEVMTKRTPARRHRAKALGA